MKRILAGMLVLVSFVAAGPQAEAGTTWTATVGGNWTNTATWGGSGIPLLGDDAIINAGKSVTVDVTTAYLNNFTNNGTLVFLGTNTALQATNVRLNGTNTHAVESATTTNADGNWYPDNRVWFVCSNLTLAGTINVNGCGFQGGPGTTVSGYGPGRGLYRAPAGGGGYGGSGGNENNAYGNTNAPDMPGSGGGGSSWSGGGAGGGLVTIAASGLVTLNGTITANGTTPGNSAGGSGGGVCITANSVAGSGSVQADGADASSSGNGSGGGGGRIAVVYDANAQAAQNLVAKPTVSFSAGIGRRLNNAYDYFGTEGTVYLTDASFFPMATMPGSYIVSPGFTNWTVPNLTLTKGMLRFDPGFQLTVLTNLTVNGVAGLDLYNCTLSVGNNFTITNSSYANTYLYGGTNSSCTVGSNLLLSTARMIWNNNTTDWTQKLDVFVGGDCLITNNALLYAYASVTNAAGVDYGARLAVTGSLVVASNSVIYPSSHAYSNNAAGLLIVASNVTIAAGASVNADGLGFSGATAINGDGYGPGKGQANKGGGHGGLGGGSSATSGKTNDSLNAPVQAGSGGGGTSWTGGESGGGIIRIVAARTITVDGTLSADSGSLPHSAAGGGAGGAINLSCTEFKGAGTVRARGLGVTSGGGGGGGRIAIMRAYSPAWTGTLRDPQEVSGGTNTSGASGANGTLTWLVLPAPPQVTNASATGIGYYFATLQGVLVATGSAPTTVSVYWGTNDAGATVTGWANTNVISGYQAQGAALSTNIDGLSSGTRYYYRFYATNSVGDGWAPTAQTFVTTAGIPVITNASGGATAVTLTSATLNGVLISTGTAPTTVSVYWGTTDGGTNAGQWANTNTFSGYVGSGPFATNVALGVTNVTYYYTYGAQNNGGLVLATPSSSFLGGALWIQATDATATELPGNTGTFTVFRDASATGLALTVNLVISGTASNGVDYQYVPSSVLMPAAASSVPITIAPFPDALVEGTETASVTLAAGLYAVGNPSIDSVSILDMVPSLTNTWSGTGNWTNAANWSSGYVALSGQTVVVTGNVTLGQSTPNFSSFTLGAGRTLTFTGTNTVLQANAITINGTVTHNANTAAAAPWTADNLVRFVCGSFNLATNGQISLDAKGYAGAPGNSVNGCGPGQGIVNGTQGGGGGYGGAGGVGSASSGLTYGLTNNPAEPGSGGAGSAWGGGGTGGGAVIIACTGQVAINGTITACGTTGESRGGGGSGGAVSINCQSLTGAGIVRADGGAPSGSGGGGGGGRIAVNYDLTAQAAQNAVAAPTVRFSANEGRAGDSYSYYGTPGTLYFPDGGFFPGTNLFGGQIVIPNLTSVVLPSLSVSQGTLSFPTGMNLTVSTDLTVNGLGGLNLNNNSLSVGRDLIFSNSLYARSTINGGTAAAITVGRTMRLSSNRLDVVNTGTTVMPFGIGTDLILTNGSQLHLYSIATNAAAPNYGARLDVGGMLKVSGNSVFYPHSHASNGGSPHLYVQTVQVDAGSQINADGLGFLHNGTGIYLTGYGYGNGGGQGNMLSGGGGYGGTGGNNDGSHGQTYGTSNAPALPGSGGGGTAWGDGYGGDGGGLIWILATGWITVDGTLSANGTVANHQHSGGGSGGGICLNALGVAGSGTIQAQGGNAYYLSADGGAGGGGRIGIRGYRHFTGLLRDPNEVAAGTNGVAGTSGTIVWFIPRGTVFTLQ